MALTLHVGHREVNLKLLDNLPSDRGAMQASRGRGVGGEKDIHGLTQHWTRHATKLSCWQGVTADAVVL